MPLSTSNQVENSPLTDMLCILLQRKSWIHAINLSLMLYDFNLVNNLPWGTVSKAFAKSA